MPRPRIWQPPTNPAATPRLPLHTLTVRLSSPGSTAGVAPDGITVRFGLRTVRASGRAILLNGEPIKLKGFNRHDMYPQLGPSLPTSRYEADLDALQLGLHANFIRGSHYPQDQRLLDLCDERGVLFWEEALAWGNNEKMLTDRRFMAAELGTAHAMLDTSINHPSLLLWGFFNEGFSQMPAATPSYAAMAAAFRSRDPTRLVTWASDMKERDLGFHLADVVSFNDYPGWYDPAADPSAIRPKWEGYAAWVAETWPDKPFLISETGAGAIAGRRGASATERWSEEYQRLVDGLDVSVAINDPNISGISVWQFTDNKADHPNSSTVRPGGINNKGVLDRWRRPKLAATRVAAVYGDEPGGRFPAPARYEIS